MSTLDLQQFEGLKALSLKQPFLQLMTIDKQETRNRNTNVRGDILLCSSQKPYNRIELMKHCDERQASRIDSKVSPYSGHKHGYATMIATLVNSRPMTKMDEDICYVRYKAGLWVWEFENRRLIEPIEYSGTRGWRNFDLTDPADIEFLSKIKFV